MLNIDKPTSLPLATLVLHVHALQDTLTQTKKNLQKLIDNVSRQPSRRSVGITQQAFVSPTCLTIVLLTVDR